MDVYDRRQQLVADVAGRYAARFVETKDIGNVGFKIFDTKSPRAARNSSRKRLSFARRLRVSVVFNGEKDRDLPLCSQIECFVDDALAERTVTDETHAQVPSALLFEGLGKPDRNWSHAALNSIREESRLPEVLAAAISARRTACPA